MSKATARGGSLNGRIGLVALLASMCLVVAAFFGASNAKAAGDPIAVDFNYVGIEVTTPLAEVRELVVTPEAGIGELQVRGNYDSGSSGAFTVPQAGGLSFPDVAIPLGPVDLEAQIALTEDASGTYNPATGAMTFNPKISLTIGVSDLAALPPEIGGLLGGGSGPLRCQLAPLAVSFSTDNGWPSPGNTFDTGPGTLKNGAVAGAWDVKPSIVATEGSQFTCDLIGGLLDTVGGLWLAQSDTPVTFADANSPKPPPAVCGDGFTGEPPNCEPVPKGVVSVPKKPANVSIKRGKRGVVRVAVKNTGDGDATGVRVCGTISAKIAKKPACVNLGTIIGGASKTAQIRLSVSKKAKGKAPLRIRVTSTDAGSANTTATVTVRR